MTPLQQLPGSIWALIPGQIPYLFITWVDAALIALVSLAIEEYRDQRPKRPILATTLFGLRVGAMFTIMIIVSAARSEGLLSGKLIVVAVAALLSSVSFSFTTRA